MTKQNNYPYQDSFEIFLKNKTLSSVTIEEYNKTLADLFNYLSNFNVGYQKQHKVNNLFTRDIEDYLIMAQTNRHINNNTYNKILSHINGYFKFLFTHNLNPNLPTIEVSSLKSIQEHPINLEWITNLDSILQDNQIHFYSRMTLLLVSKGFKANEFLQPGFYNLLPTINFNSIEKNFLYQFNNFIHPIQIKQHSNDIFLKQRFSADPHITMAGLHKYLTPSEQHLNMSLSPSDLFQSYIINYMQKNPKLSNLELSSNLNLDLSSINYYQKLLARIRLNM
jgi:hypothetical protein